MQKISLYRYIRADGGVTVSPVKPDCEYTVMFRLIAGEGMLLTDGNTLTYSIDTEAPESLNEVVDNTYEATESMEYSE